MLIKTGLTPPNVRLKAHCQSNSYYKNMPKILNPQKKSLITQVQSQFAAHAIFKDIISKLYLF